MQAEQRGEESIWLLAFGFVAAWQPGKQPAVMCLLKASILTAIFS